MKRIIISLIAVSFLAMMATMALAQETKTAAASKTFKYVGVAKCKMCHKGEKHGNVFEIWEKSKHATAYATLATEHSKEVAKKVGIQGDPQKAAECLVCHVTAYSVAAELKDPSLTLEEGVSCEACHGPGSEYKSMKVMKDIYAGTVKGADFGLIEPTNEVCVTCHNPKSPTYKEFKYEVEVKNIAHAVPKEVKE